MGLSSIVRFLLPRDDKFLNYFEQAADNLKEAGDLYVGLSKINSRAELIGLRDEIKRLEHIGDELTHKIFEELNLSFITPLIEKTFMSSRKESTTCSTLLTTWRSF